MTACHSIPLRLLALSMLAAYPLLGIAQVPNASETPVAAPSAAEPAKAPDATASENAEETAHPGGNAIVSIGHDANLAAGGTADSVVAVFGNATSAGTVHHGVVSVLGNATVKGPVSEGAVAVLGNVYVDSNVDGDVVAVLGNVELGPNARVTGSTVVVFGTIQRAPKSVVLGETSQIIGVNVPSMQWLTPWFKHCALLGRPLALEPGLEWAWALALGFLALYILLALLFREPMEQCVRTLETQPGRSLLASLLTLLLTPAVFFALLITIILAVVIPFLGLAMLAAGLFGKAVMLLVIGRRITQPFNVPALSHPASGVLIGGVVVLGLYLIPFIGFLVYNLLGIVGLGVVMYTILLNVKVARANAAAAQARTATAADPSVDGLATAGVSSTYTASAAAAADPRFAAGSATARPSETQPPPNQPSVPEAATFPRATFWPRMGALFVDLVLIAIILSVINGDYLLVILAAYGAVMWKLKGTTVGGVLLGLKVVRTDGRPIDWPTAVIRALSCFLSLVFAFLGFFWIIFDEERQAWHDKIAGTVVVRVPKGVSLV